MLDPHAGDDIAGLTSDEVLARHRKKYEADREWIQQQTELLRQLRPGSGGTSQQQQQQQQGNFGGGGSAANPTPRSAEARFRGSTGAAPSAQQQQHGGNLSPTFAYPRQQQQQYGASHRVTGSALTVHTRASQWQKRRSQKLDELRRQQQALEFSECTFRPAVDGGASSLGGSARRNRGQQEITDSYYGFAAETGVNNNNSSSSAAAIGGVEDFLQRQERARQLVIEKADRFRCDGSKWKQEATQPEPFKLGVRVAGGPRIRALAPPLVPAEASVDLQPSPSSPFAGGGQSSPTRAARHALDQCSIPQGAFSAAISSPGASFRVV